MTFHIWILESPIILSTLVFKNQKILISFWTIKGKTSLDLECVAFFLRKIPSILTAVNKLLAILDNIYLVITKKVRKK